MPSRSESGRTIAIAASPITTTTSTTATCLNLILAKWPSCVQYHSSYGDAARRMRHVAPAATELAAQEAPAEGAQPADA